jgi:thiamine biosynthesis lipoprotein
MGRRALFGRLLPRAAEVPGRRVKAHRTAMACRFEVTLPAEDARHVEAARAALDELDAIESQLSRLRDESELARVNREAATGPVVVSPGVFAFLSLCQELSAATGGAFDPASAAISRCWGVLERHPRAPSHEGVPSEEEIAAARAASGMDKIVLDGLSRTVRFAAAGVELDAEAVGKGWALDRVAASLRVRRVGRALLTAGGSHRGWGAGEWELTLRPGGEELGRLRLRDAALATSSRPGHLLDPRTGRPAEGVRSASVVATETAVADALSTAFLVAGPELAASFCAARPGTMALLVLDAAPREIRVCGKRDGVTVDTAAGVRLVEARG